MDVRDRFKIHPDFPLILRNWTREVLRYNPEDIVTFSRDYFVRYEHVVDGQQSFCLWLEMHISLELHRARARNLCGTTF